MFKKLFSKSKETEAAPTHDPLHLAVAVLMIEAAVADQHFDENERNIISKALRENFSIIEADADALVEAAAEEQKNAVDIQRFTRVAKEMGRAEKVRFIETLWRIVLSDDERDPYEETLIRRVCGLIYV
ncbi:MAG: TerB family tellurite resistance protein, partial [Marinicaulis sp.]|nr:TerB family tellurite resistance protein [Marinicaulis sp.]